MKRLLVVFSTVCFLILGIASCKKVELVSYADKIEAQLKDKPYGYAFVVSKLGEPRVERAWGLARMAQDPPEKNMTVDVKYTLASVSKNITAAAAIKLLSEKGISLDDKIVTQLPWNWEPGANVDTITFRELLRHGSGIRCEAFGTYENLKKCIEDGIQLADKQSGCNDPIGDGTGCYKNFNYALFRVIIPVVMGQIKKPVLSTFTEKQTDQQNAIVAANAYIRYVNENVFAKAGLPDLTCAPTDGAQQGLTYKHAAPSGKGGDFGDKKMECGAEGWFLSASQLATYFHTLNNTNKIVSPTQAAQMRTEFMGYKGFGEFNTPDGKVQYWLHPGGHPAAMNPGEVQTLLLRFSNGTELAIIINSDMTANVKDVAVNAMSEVLNGI